MSKIINYLKETRAEMKNVVWPTRKQAVYSTIIVIAVSVLIAYYLGLFDFLFSKVLSSLLSKF